MTLTKKQREESKNVAIETLKKILKPKDWVSTLVKKVSASGMSRQMVILVGDEDGKVLNISHLVAAALEWREKNDAIIVDGCGMDMGFHTVEQLSRALGYYETNGNTNAYGLNQKWL